MRLIPFIVAIALSASGAAVAQTPPSAPPPAAAPPAAAAPAGITRDQYIQHAQERAAKAAATRFDKMDADHDGILTADEIRAYRAAHPRRKAAPPAQ
jgi:hypothetical protein